MSCKAGSLCIGLLLCLMVNWVKLFDLPACAVSWKIKWISGSVRVTVCKCRTGSSSPLQCPVTLWSEHLMSFVIPLTPAQGCSWHQSPDWEQHSRAAHICASHILGFLLWALHTPGKQNCSGQWALVSCRSWHVWRRDEVPWGGLCEEPLWLGPSAESLSRTPSLGSHCCLSRNCSALFGPGCPKDWRIPQENSELWERKASLYLGDHPGAGFRAWNVTKALD